jgi:hypothetical protein
MRRLLVVLVVLLAGIVGLGFYQGWFRVSTASTDDKVNTTITIDKDKIQADEQKAKEQVRNFGQGAKEKTGEPADKVKEPEGRP